MLSLFFCIVAIPLHRQRLSVNRNFEFEFLDLNRMERSTLNCGQLEQNPQQESLHLHSTFRSSISTHPLLCLRPSSRIDSVQPIHSSTAFILTMEDPTKVGRLAKAAKRKAQAEDVSEVRLAVEDPTIEGKRNKASKRRVREEDEIEARPVMKAPPKKVPTGDAAFFAWLENTEARTATRASTKRASTKKAPPKNTPSGDVSEAPQKNKLKEEQRAAKNARSRERYHEMTDEKRAAKSARDVARARQRRQEMPDEQREAEKAKKRAYTKQRYHEMTDEKRAAKSARDVARKRQRKQETAKLQGKTARRWEPSVEEDFHSTINEFLDAEKDLSSEAVNDLLSWRDCEAVRDLEGIDKNMTKYTKGSWRLQALAKRRLYDRQLMDGSPKEKKAQKKAKNYLSKGEKDVLNSAGKLTRGFMRCGGELSEAVWVTLEHAYDVNNMSTPKGQERAHRDAWPPNDPNAVPSELNFDESFARFEEQCQKNNRQYPQYLRSPPDPTWLARQLLAGAMEFYRKFRSRKYPHVIICGLEPSRRQWQGVDIPHVSFLFVMDKQKNGNPWKKEMVDFLREWGLRFKNDSLFDPKAEETADETVDETANEPDNDESDVDSDSETEVEDIQDSDLVTGKSLCVIPFEFWDLLLVILYLLKWQKKHKESLSMSRWNAWLREINLPVTLLNAAFIQVASFRFRHYLVPLVPPRNPYLHGQMTDSMDGSRQNTLLLSQGQSSQIPLSLSQAMMSQSPPQQEEKVDFDLEVIREVNPAEEEKVTEEYAEETPLLSGEEEGEMHDFEISISNNSELEV